MKNKTKHKIKNYLAALNVDKILAKLWKERRYTWVDYAEFYSACREEGRASDGVDSMELNWEKILPCLLKIIGMNNTLVMKWIDKNDLEYKICEEYDQWLNWEDLAYEWRAEQ